MEEVDHQTSSTDPMLACCLCRRLLQDAVQLMCLHNCCQQCFSTAAATGDSQQVACGSCDTVTRAGCERPNEFIDRQVQRHQLVAESKVCDKCLENGERNMLAILWCPTCRHSLCDGCIALHRLYFKQHVTQCLDELRNVSEVFSLESPSICQIHKKPVDIACRNCEQAKCITCWAKCNEKKHEMHVIGKDSFDSYIGEFVACISAMESELLRKSEVLEKPKSFLRDTRVARDCHLENLRGRKRLIIDAVDMVYQEIELSTKIAYDNLEDHGESEDAAADRIASNISVARSYIRRLIGSNDKCEILKQQKTVRERLLVLSAQLDALSDRLAATVGEVKIDASLPEDLELVLRTWIGVTQLLSAPVSSPAPPQQYLQPPQQHPEQLQLQSEQQQHQQQSFSFGAASGCVQLPTECADVALTTDGRSMLLAAKRHGLIEFCSSSGRELSRWLPPEDKHSNRIEDCGDQVLAVAPLSDGRAAVSLAVAKLVVLLRRRKLGESCGSGVASIACDAWTVDSRLCELVRSPGLLSAHGVVLAVQLPHENQLRLMNWSSGQRFSADLPCKCITVSLAVTERSVVVGGKMDVWISCPEPHPMYVLDAYNLAYGQRLWHRKLISNSGDQREQWEHLHGVCADSTGGFLYAAVSRGDWSIGRVSELSLSDGSELQRFALSFDKATAPKQLSMPPWRLSLSEDSTGAAQQQLSSSRRAVSSGSRRALLLAVLCRDSTSNVFNLVALHPSIAVERV